MLDLSDLDVVDLFLVDELALEVVPVFDFADVEPLLLVPDVLLVLPDDEDDAVGESELYDESELPELLPDPKLLPDPELLPDKDEPEELDVLPDRLPDD